MKTIGIIGLGLIGGSLGLALSKHTNHTVLGYDIDPTVLKKACALGAVTEPISEADYNNLDVVVFCLNPNLIISQMEAVVKKLKSGALVLDIAGNKTQVVNAMQSLSQKYPDVQFISAHPMAGKEVFGIGNAAASLFKDASCILMPVNASEKTLAKTKQTLKDVGFGLVFETSASLHDAMIAYTSQLPHLLSSSYVANPKAEAHHGFSAGSFNDLTRVAKMNADMWADLFLENADNLLSELNVFLNRAEQFKFALKDKNRQKLHALLSEGNLIKEKIETDAKN
jgi:prephenate dehydrogenase